jgi:hypothetical protein
MSFLSDINTSTAEPCELALFTNQVALQKIYFSETRPISSFSADDAPLEFAVPGSGNEYLDLRRSRLYLKAKITKADGIALQAQGRQESSTYPCSPCFLRSTCS